MTTRTATHAGSWYPSKPTHLASLLDSFIANTPSDGHDRKGCRIIISPHAGYSYSGQTAAFGFKALDWNNINRVFILGPSHKFYLRKCALTRLQSYSTPFGELKIDTEMITKLKADQMFDSMPRDVDENEHSIEMQLPFLKHVMPEDRDIPVVPILVGNLDTQSEIAYGRRLAEYVEDPSNLFVISSDFCHWGNRFQYTAYQAEDRPLVAKVSEKDLHNGVPIWQSIDAMDHEAIQIIESGSHKDFAKYLARTRNTICGRHPIGVILAALEHTKITAHFTFLDYRQSNKVTSIDDGSVSYASGICCP